MLLVEDDHVVETVPSVLALFVVGDVYVSLCQKKRLRSISVRRRSRALFWL